MSTAKRQIEAEAADHDEGVCVDCGSRLTDEEIRCGRDMCFDCYVWHQSGDDR